MKIPCAHCKKLYTVPNKGQNCRHCDMPICGDCNLIKAPVCPKLKQSALAVTAQTSFDRRLPRHERYDGPLKPDTPDFLPNWIN